MKSIKLTTSLLVFFVLCSPIYAQDFQKAELSIDQAVNYALQNSPQFKNVRINTQISKKKVNETLGRGLPQISATSDFTHFPEVPVTFIPGAFFGDPDKEFVGVKFSPAYNGGAGVTVNQLIFDGSYIVGIKAANVFKQLSVKDEEIAKQDLVIEVKKAYYGSLLTVSKLIVATTTKDRLKVLLNDTKGLYDNGFAEKIDVDRIKVLVNNINVEEIRLFKINQLNNQYLKALIGMPLETRLTLSDRITELDVSFSGSIGDPIETESRIEMQKFDIQMQLQGLDLKAKQSSFLPNLSAFAGYNYNTQANSFDVEAFRDNLFPNSAVGLRLRWNIFSGGSKISQISQSRLTLKQLENTRGFYKTQLQLEEMSARTNYESNLKSLEVQKENVELANEIYRVSKIKYDEGLGSNLEVIDADSSLKEAQANYTNAYYNVLVAKIDLEKALGLIE
ncbi:MAG: outer membrane protein [Sphingobacteriales bacterium]|jgi:outer membrane protein